MLSGAYLLSSTNSHKIMNFMVRIFCSRLLLMTRFKCPDIKVSLLVTMLVIMSLRKKRGVGGEGFKSMIYGCLMPYTVCAIFIYQQTVYIGVTR